MDEKENYILKKLEDLTIQASTLTPVFALIKMKKVLEDIYDDGIDEGYISGHEKGFTDGFEKATNIKIN